MSRPTDTPTYVRRLEGWLDDAKKAALPYLPGLLASPPAILKRELTSQSELLSIPVLRSLLEHARANFETYPVHALEITTIVVESLDHLQVPPEFRPYAVEFMGDAWKEHATALQGRLRPQESLSVSAKARDLYGRLGGASDAKLAILDLVDSTAYQELGDTTTALKLVRNAAVTLDRYGDSQGVLNARIIEGWILYSLERYEDVRTLWTAAAADAERKGNKEALARLHNNIGHLICETGGDLGAASASFRRALELFTELDMRTERPKVRWGHAKILGRRGQIHAALSEYYTVEAEFLAIGSTGDAALAALATIGILIELGRSEQARQRARELVVTFGNAGMLPNALVALKYLREATHGGRLSIGILDHISRFFVELARNPLLTFMPPPELQS
jgi:tetratricopeptide (TPR) repeat protein